MIEDLFDFDLLHELINELAENGEYKYSENGLNISAKSSDNYFTLEMSYEKSYKTEAEDFREYIESLDDELFIEVCESLGQDKLTQITNCLNSKDIESVRSGILRFKQELKEILTDKIDYYQECLGNLTM